MFLIITFIAVPVYGVYSGSNQSGLEELESISWKYALNRFTLGNLGGSTVECRVKRLKEISAS